MDHITKQITDKLYGSEDGLPSYAIPRNFHQTRFVAIDLLPNAPLWSEEVATEYGDRTVTARLNVIEIHMVSKSDGSWEVETVSAEGQYLRQDGSNALHFSRAWHGPADRHSSYVHGIDTLPEWMSEIVRIEKER